MSADTGEQARPARADDLVALGEIADRAAAQMSDENFPVALRLLPGRIREQLARVYTFARFVDDVGDEADGDRSALLAAVAGDLHALGAGGNATLGPVAGLRPVLDAQVPVQPFLDLVAANVQDQQVTRYQTRDDLLGYCDLSAAPVGRVVLHLAGAATADNVRDSDAVCAALQILEHCQDVGEDARAGRIYLPAHELRAAGVVEATLRGRVTGNALRGVVARQVEQAEAGLHAGAPLVGRLSGWAKLAVAGYVAGGLATADALRQASFDVLGREIGPARSRTVGHALRLIISRSRHGR
jgi:squalene synthase HpnC